MSLLSLNKKLEKLDRTSSKSFNSRSRFNRKFFIRLGLVLLVFVLATYIPARSIYSSLRSMKQQVSIINLGIKNQNIDEIKKGTTGAKKAAININSSLNWFIYLRLIPFFGGYYSDLKHFSVALESELTASEIIVDTLIPHKQELGFTGTPTPGQDKIAQAVKVLDKVLPEVDKVEPYLKKASDEVSKVNINKYPEKFGTTRVKVRLEQAKNFITGAHYAVTQAKEALQIAPNALGQPNAKTYLMLFQNDKEIRATGGFITAYAFLKLDKGHLSTSNSDDIYRLDERLLNVCKNKVCPLTPPEPIVRYLPEMNGKARTAWSMRDSNISPDLAISAKTFEDMYKLLGDGESFDGIITIDTQVVEELIAITGPIDVFGTKYSAETDSRCNCPNVVYELEHYAEVAAKGEADRKAVVGTLMQQLLARALGGDPATLPDFVSAGVKLANQKHVMFYMHDKKTQDALTKLGWTGRIERDQLDYIHVNDSNFAGGKSNLYVEEKIVLEVNKDTSGNVKNKITIEYKNPQPFNIWLNGILRDYVRVYVPQGAKMIASKGSDVPVTTQVDKELNKTYFEAFITVRPQNSRTLSFEYSLPNKWEKPDYELLVQKQPGAKDHKYTVKVNGKVKDDFALEQDHRIKVGF